MSFRFWQRIRLAPWITLNLSKSSASLSVGPPGAKYTIGPRGHRVTAGLPGSGLFYTVHAPHGGSGGRRAKAPAATPPSVPEFCAIWRAGASSALRRISRPVRSSPS